MNLNVLILGGTSEARALAAALVSANVTVTSSLAGRVSRPRLPEGLVRIGGFGGVDGLRAYLVEEGVTHVIDATHPFAIGMRTNAVDACAQVSVPLVRYARPGWVEHPYASTWHWVDDYDEAREAAQRLGKYPFLTSGRQTLSHYLSWTEAHALVRVVEPLDHDVPDRWQVRLDRGPFTVDDEVALMRDHDTDVLVTKDSGGAYTSAKLDAAHQLGIPVVVVKRPSPPRGLIEFAQQADVLAWLGLDASA